MKTIISVCSARPNFVKLAAVHHALIEAGGFNHVIVHTGQHYDPLFSDIFFEQLQIPNPQFNLGIPGGDRLQVIASTQFAFAETLPQVKPDIVLVYGDVNGAVGAALAAKGAGYKLGHVEAGLRSYDDTMPEEHNRIAIDGMADMLFCSEASGMAHIAEEEIKGKSFLVGNTMIDTLVRMLPAVKTAELPQNLPEQYGIVTLHRPSNVDDKISLGRNVDMLLSLSAHIPLILPMHHRLRASLEKHGFLDAVSQNIQVLPPLGYLPFLRLVSGARFILTDSGGIQEEATFLKKRCYTLRKNTERPATLDSGSNVLVDLGLEHDRELLLQAAMNTSEPEVDIPAIWDGKAGARIATILSENL
jgi:UDP-N-acetylglucosamine 2-epimerase (non-hydrolysing)